MPRLLFRFLKIFLLAGLGLAAIVAALGWWFIVRPLPTKGGVVRAAGLQREVIVQRDAQGVPHIRAASPEDLYFAQGWVTASERLWQMDMLRRLAGGTLAEVAGEQALRSDSDRRMLGIRQSAEAAAQTLPADQRRLFDAYVAGVNAYMSSQPLALEFHLMRYRPQRWTVADSMLVGLHMFHVLTTTWRDEFLKLLLTSKVGPEKTAELLVTRTDRDHPPMASMSLAQPSRERERAVPMTVDWYRSLTVAALSTDEGLPGSNNWVVSGAHTASGKPMLANDPHLGYSVPGIWFMVHLDGPGMRVSGASLPGMPSVIIGHNEHIAWGATNMGADVQDVYLETFDPKDPKRYRADGEWRTLELRREVIPSRGGGQREFTTELTRHGPIILTQGASRYSLRWIATERHPWKAPFFAVNAARNWTEFMEAFRDFPGPAQNFVYADREGNIGYLGAGMIPIRPRGDGSVPLDGADSRNDWAGYIPFDQLPRVYNPPSGVIVTANGRIVPDGYPYPVATKWESPDRTERIYGLLNDHIGNGGKLRAADFTRIQGDVYSSHYRALARAFGDALGRRRGDGRSLRIAAQLRNWSGEVSANSAEASLVQFARQELLKALLEPGIGPAYMWYRWRMSTVFLESVIAQRPPRWLPPGETDYDEVFARSVDRAARNLSDHFRTEDLTQWSWGSLIRTSFAHPAGAHVPRLIRSRFIAGPFQQSGNSYTVKQTTPNLGQSMRMVVDFGNLDETILTLPMGQSGHVFSRNFKDQFETWRTGEAVKHAFTPAAVEKSTVTTLRLMP